jgi:hypothetical protein
MTRRHSRFLNDDEFTRWNGWAVQMIGAKIDYLDCGVYKHTLEDMSFYGLLKELIETGHQGSCTGSIASQVETNERKEFGSIFNLKELIWLI